VNVGVPNGSGYGNATFQPKIVGGRPSFSFPSLLFPYLTLSFSSPPSLRTRPLKSARGLGGGAPVIEFGAF